MSQYEKKVLVTFGDNRRPVSFQGGVTNLTLKIKERFSDCGIEKDDTIVLQIKSKEWGGIFVDMEPDEVIPDKCVINAVSSKVFIPKMCMLLNLYTQVIIIV